MPYDNSPQANLPRFNTPTFVSQADFDEAVSNMVNLQGPNYRFNSATGVLEFYNRDQARWTPIYTAGANGAQQTGLDDTTA